MNKKYKGANNVIYFKKLMCRQYWDIKAKCPVSTCSYNMPGIGILVKQCKRSTFSESE